MSRSTAMKAIGVGALALALGFAGGAAIAVGPTLLTPAGLTAEKGVDAKPMPSPSYPTNAHGESFGSIKDARSPQEEPELIQAVATNGETGYVRKSELDAVNGTSAMATFKSPEEALAWQAENLGKSFAVPVYLQDGKTVVGEFVVTSEDATISTDSTAG
jgi:hypothetical protein